MKKSFPLGIAFVSRPRWTGIRFNTRWTVWCCCHVYSFWCSCKFTLMPAVHLEKPDFVSCPLVHARLREVMCSNSLAGHLWNHLKALKRVLLDFGYRSNTAATETIHVLGSSMIVCKPLMVQLSLQLSDRKWWALLAGPLPVIVIKVLGQTNYQYDFSQSMYTSYCPRMNSWSYLLWRKVWAIR